MILFFNLVALFTHLYFFCISAIFIRIEISQASISSKSTDLHGLTPDRYGLEPALNGLVPALYGLVPALYGLVPAFPGLEPGPSDEREDRRRINSLEMKRNISNPNQDNLFKLCKSTNTFYKNPSNLRYLTFITSIKYK